MVFFTCNNCGESLKKGAVEKHYSFSSCKSKTKSLCCIDCLKDFKEEAYVQHIKCVTEDERYSAKGFVAKPEKNKGALKQELWLEIIRDVLLNKPTVDADTKKILTRICDQTNVPRKKLKFVNFIRNSMKLSPNNCERIWTLIEEANVEFQKRAHAKQAAANPNKSAVSEPDDMEEAGDNNNDNNVDKDKKNKKAKKRKLKDNETDNKEMEQEDQTTADDLPMKKKKKKNVKQSNGKSSVDIEEISIAGEMVATTTVHNLLTSSSPSKKKKKNKKSKQLNGNPIIENAPPTTTDDNIEETNDMIMDNNSSAEVSEKTKKKKNKKKKNLLNNNKMEIVQVKSSTNGLLSAEVAQIKKKPKNKNKKSKIVV